MKNNLLFVSLFFILSSQAQTITTIAGTGVAGYNGDNISAITAKINDAYFITTDSVNNVYVGDYGNHCVRKITPSGIITTIAGMPGTQGYTGNGGLATNARLTGPTGVALDKAGNIYIADCGNMVIRKIDKATGIITTVAGNHTGSYSGDGGQATNATLNHPSSIAFNATGEMFIADCYNHVIRKVALNGIISTYAGTGITAGFSGDEGQAISAKLNLPYTLTFDNNGDMVFGDYANYRIRKISSTTGIIKTIAGTGAQTYTGDGDQAVNASFYGPVNVICNAAGELFVADQYNYVIRKISTNGVVSTIAGNGTMGFSGDNGPATTAQFNQPICLAFDTQGNLFVSDRNNNRIRKIAMSALPVKLTNFNASVSQKNVVCNWETENEINSGNFIVERSINGVEFTAVGEIKAAGNSMATKKYSFTDVNAVLLNVKQIYYRLISVDKDGSRAYSKIVVLNLTANSVVLHWPNPVKNQLNVQISNYSGKVIFTIYNMLGNTLQNLDKNIVAGEKVIININDLKAGSYILSCNINGVITNNKFVKE